MNFEKFTEKAQSAIVDCQNYAIAEGHQQLDGEHLHLALVKTGSGPDRKTSRIYGNPESGDHIRTGKGSFKVAEGSGRSAVCISAFQ